ncbi:MAG: IclR family transcriptional regulator [Hyphomicrobiaceae bacterium]
MTVAAVERCLGLLETLADEAEPVELAELAERVGLPNSAAHRILATLLTRGWVMQDEATQRYALSLRFCTLAFRNLDARAVPDVVQIVLDKLAQRTHEYCRLALVEGENLVWVAHAQGAKAGLRYDPDMGQDLVLHATANGKAWLATLSEQEALRIACARGFKATHPLGPRALSSVDDLRVHLKETRRRGYATAVDEGEGGTAAIAVPFYASQSEDAKVAGTISVAGPIQRLVPERYEDLSRELTWAASELSSIWLLRIRQRNSWSRQVAADATHRVDHLNSGGAA